MTQERMLELFLLQSVFKKEMFVDFNRYDKRKIMKRYIELKKDFLKDYLTD